jgi:hypothetical protein
LRFGHISSGIKVLNRQPKYFKIQSYRNILVCFVAKSGGDFISVKAKTKSSTYKGQSYPNKQQMAVLLKEYSINADFWKHHDTMRQKKMENFLTANSILAAAVALLTSGVFSSIQDISIILVIGISIIAFFISVTWNSVMRRNSDYMRFQRLQLCSIEQALPNGFETFTKMYKAFDNGTPIPFPCVPQPEPPEPFQTKTESANKLEAALPKIIAASWIILAVSCVAFLIYSYH